MNFATLLRYVKLENNDVWDHRYYALNTYYIFAQKYKIGMNAIYNEYGFEDICEKCDGFFLPGSGTNINPEYYGKPPFETPDPVDEYALDSKLIEYFINHNKPIFGICGGLQAINVFMGGSLKKVADVDAHQNYEKSNHLIDIKEGSFVHDVFGAKEALINSYHSWCIDKLAPGLEAVAWTKDGVIEAVESKEKRIYATQWHPELSFEAFPNDTEQKFIENFINLCRR